MAISVLLAAEVASPEAALENLPGYGLGSFKAGLARSLQQRLVWAPTEEDPGHVHVVGDKNKEVRRQLRDGTILLVEPPER